MRHLNFVKLLAIFVMLSACALFPAKTFAQTTAAGRTVTCTYTGNGGGVTSTYTIVPQSDTQVIVYATFTMWGYPMSLETRLDLSSSSGSAGMLRSVVQPDPTGWFKALIYTERAPNGIYSFPTDGLPFPMDQPYTLSGWSVYDVVPGTTYTFAATAGCNGTFTSSTAPGAWGYFTAGQPMPSLPGDLGKQGTGVNQTQPHGTVGEPVSVISGAFLENQVDFIVSGAMPITVGRTYSSANSESTNELGYGWLPSYPSYLVPASDLSTINAADSDGSVIVFRRQGSSNTWTVSIADNPGLTSSSGLNNRYNDTITLSGASTYYWNMSDGSTRKYIVRNFPVSFGGQTIDEQYPYIDTITDNRGNTLSFIFGSNSLSGSYGHITQITSSSGGSVTYSYNASCLMTQAQASDGRTVTYAYDGRGDLVQVTRPDGHSFYYDYAPVGIYQPGNPYKFHMLDEVTDPDGGVLLNYYDSISLKVVNQKAKVDQSNPTAFISTNLYSYAPGVTRVKDAYGNLTTYTYSDNGLIYSILDPLGQAVQQSWYSSTDSSAGAYANSLQSVIDKRGLVTTYKYDSNGNLLSTKVSGNLTGSSSNSEEVATTATYNSRNLPITMVDAAGITSTFTYGDPSYPYLPTQLTTSKGTNTLRTDQFHYGVVGGSRGLLTQKVVAVGSTDQVTTDYQYDSAGNLTERTDHTGTTDPDVVVDYGYNSRSELTSVTDGDGRVTKFTYDSMSRPLTKTVLDENSNVLGVWTTTYSRNGLVSTLTGARTGPADTVQKVYDGNGRLEQEVVALSQAKSDGTGVTVASTSAVTDYIVDYAGNLVATVDPIGNETVMVYDGDGQLITKNTADMRQESYDYEPGGKVSEYTNPLGGVTTYSYSSAGKLLSQSNPDGSILQWRYYLDGRIQKEILSNGSYWTTVYDDVARTATRTLSSSAGTILAMEINAFDRRGNLVSHTDAEGYIKSTTFDGLNRIKSVTGAAATLSSAQQITTYSYGASSKSVTVSNALGEKVVTTSDALGRLQQKKILNSAGATIRITGYAYSPDQNSVTVTEGSGSGSISNTTWTDTLNRPVLTVHGDGSFTRQAYDLNGNLVSTTDALQQTTSFAYNPLNQRVSSTLPDGTVANFSYDVAGNLLARAMGNGTLNQVISYDNAGRKIHERLFSGDATTREYTYAYYAAGNAAVGLLQTTTGPRETITTTYDDLLRPQTVTTAGMLSETNGTTTYGYDKRSLVTSIAQSSLADAAGPASRIDRTYDGYGQIVAETVTAGGVTYANTSQTWDGAGRRLTLDDSSNSLPSPLFAFQRRADGLLTQVTANQQNYAFAWADNGLLTSRTNPYRTLNVSLRDAAGRLLEQTATVGTTTTLIEDLIWRANNTLSSYTATRSNAPTWDETRQYSYNSRGQLLSEDFSPATNLVSTLSYKFDGDTTGLGVRLDAKVSAGRPASWEVSSTANSLGRVITDRSDAAAGRMASATGNATNADHVELFVDGLSLGRATLSGSAWSANLALSAGAHSLVAKATDFSGLYITSSSANSFTVTAANAGEQTGTITTAYDAEGNVITRSWANGLTQNLSWDAFGRLVRVAQRDSSNNGYDWTAIYDGIGRRISSTQQPVTANTPSGSSSTTTSIYDPQVEFLEIGVAVNGAKAWKVYGPDLNGRYGGLQGTGGLEATIVDSSGATKGVINDQFGNGVATVSSGTVTWGETHVGGYGPLPGSLAENLTDITRVAEATCWRGRRIDPTGFFDLGARYYESNTGRFLSADPMGHAASMSLYDFCNGDPVNFFDPDGRCGNSTDSFLNSLQKWDQRLWDFQKGYLIDPLVDMATSPFTQVWNYAQSVQRVMNDPLGIEDGILDEQERQIRGYGNLVDTISSPSKWTAEGIGQGVNVAQGLPFLVSAAWEANLTLGGEIEVPSAAVVRSVGTDLSEEGVTLDETSQVFHRKNDSIETLEKIENSNELWGQPTRNNMPSDIPKVKAFDGPLPDGATGFEFQTDVPPDVGSVPGKPTWSGPRPGVSVDGDWAKIPVKITYQNIRTGG